VMCARTSIVMTENASTASADQKASGEVYVDGRFRTRLLDPSATAARAARR